MPSTFTWLDFSEQQRQQALDVLDLFREQDTRDELGIGTVRDALADLLFPGTSTIQTRARYFLFIPWIYLDLEQRRVSSDKIAARARNEETRLIESLAQSDFVVEEFAMDRPDLKPGEAPEVACPRCGRPMKMTKPNEKAT